MSSGSKAVGRLVRLTDMKLLPLKEYEEKLPENVTKAILRVIAQSLRDAKIVCQIDKEDKFLRQMTQIPLSLLNITMAKADTRTWLTAPESISFYSGRIDGHKLTILIRNRVGNVIDSQHVKIDPNKTNIINLRCFDNNSYAQSICFDSSGGNRPSYTIPENLERMTIAVQCANIRNKATTSSRIIVKLCRGQQVGIIDKQGRWFRVVTPIGKEGWAREDLFGPRPDPTSAAPKPQGPHPDSKNLGLGLGLDY